MSSEDRTDRVLGARSKLTGAAVGTVAVAACAACCAAPIAGILAAAGIASGVAGLLLPALWGLAIVLGIAAAAVYLRRRFRPQSTSVPQPVTIGLPTYIDRGGELDCAGHGAESLK